MNQQFERFRAAIAERYTLGRELGVGGTATVFLADDERYRRRVAIKVFRPEIAISLGHERFAREIALAAKLSHPHILPLLDSGEEEGLMFYVMPAIEGESLRERINREKQLPIDALMQVARDVAVALDYAHAHGVVHRDIKPENILITAGTSVVADFGIAKMLDGGSGDTSVTRAGVAVGTALYMSPEQASATLVDGRADIYSLGCVVFEMLAGSPPYMGRNPQMVLSMHCTAPIPSVLPLRAGIAPMMDMVVMRALAKSPEERFGTAVDFVDALATARRAASHERVRLSMTEIVAAQERALTMERARNDSANAARVAAPAQSVDAGTAAPSRWPWVAIGAAVLLALLALVWRLTIGAP
ncbi:MAG: serine/threonine-protein kinase [Gemmatimonadaceae bacterium]